MTPAFSDHFSALAAGYARHRPSYPAELYAYLGDQAPARDRAWDCATGTGQAAAGLCRHFREVVATDASSRQVGHAAPARNVQYRVAPAEASGLPDTSVDLVTVAQALHWFDLAAFYAEARRVLRPGGLVAAWSYGLFRVDPALDELVARLYEDVLGPYWPPERRHVERGYRDLPFPFRRLDPPTFEMTVRWNLADTVGYLRTWSAVGRYRERCGKDPVAGLVPALTAAWGDPDGRRTVRWPLNLLVGTV